MKKILPLVLASAALGSAVLLSRGGASRESLLPLSRAVADQEKGLDRTVSAAFPLSPDEERAIGAGMDRSLSRTAPPDSPRAVVLASRWREFGSDAARSPLIVRFRGRCEFRVTAQGGLNAFALPGCFIYITQGLLERLGDDGDALTAVAGHELGHVELGHCADAYRLTAASRDPVTTILGGVLTVPRLFASLHFSQTQELEADAYSVRLMRSRGRDPRAALRVFDALGLRADSRTKRGPDEVLVEGLGDYFRTHPGSWERRAALERRISGAD